MPPKANNNKAAPANNNKNAPANNKAATAPAAKQELPENLPINNFGQFISVAADKVIEDQYLSATNTTTPLVNIINSLHELPFGVSNVPNDPCGRRAVAKVDLPAGATVIVERSPLWVIAVSSIQEFCGCCGANFESLTNPTTIRYDATGMYAYCNAQCQTAHQEIYLIEEPLLSLYPQYTQTLQIDIDLLRLAIKYLILKYLAQKKGEDKNMSIVYPNGEMKKNISLQIQQQQSEPSADETKQQKAHVNAQQHVTTNLPIIQPTVHDIAGLQLHAQHENDQGIIQTSKTAVKTLYPLLRTFCAGTFLHTLYYASKPQAAGNIANIMAIDYQDELEEDLLSITGKINANIHALETYTVDPPSTPAVVSFNPQYSYGMGLFPIGAMFNHSCEPNCLFINQGQKLCIRTIAPIAKGEELFVNYVSLNNDIFNRKFELLKSKGFWCSCRRCLCQISEKVLLTKPPAATSTNTPSNQPDIKIPVIKGKPAPKPIQNAKTSAQSNATPTTNVEKEDPTMLSKAELCDEKTTRLLFDAFIGNAYKKRAIDAIIASGAVEYPKNINTVTLNQRQKDQAALRTKYLIPNTNTTTYPDSLTTAVSTYAQESEKLVSTLQSTTKTLRSDYDKQLRAVQKQQKEFAAAQQQDPEAATSTTQNNNTSPPDVSAILSNIPTTKLFNELNNLYPGGLYIPVFNKQQATFPSDVADYYQTVVMNVNIISTQIDTNTTTNQSTKTTQLDADYQNKVMYTMILLDQVLEGELEALLQLVQENVQFKIKQQQLEVFWRMLMEYHPMGSLHHQQYQVVSLVANVLTQLTGPTNTVQGLKYFLQHSLPVFKLMHFSSLYVYPTLFLSHLEVYDNVYKASRKAENLIAVNAKLQGPEGLIVKNLAKQQQELIKTLKSISMKRLVSVANTVYGKKHKQALYFSQLK